MKRSAILIVSFALVAVMSLATLSTVYAGGNGGSVTTRGAAADTWYQQHLTMNPTQAMQRCFPDGYCIQMWQHSGETAMYINMYPTYAAVVQAFSSAWHGGNPEYDSSGRLLGMSCNNGSYFLVLHCDNGATNYPTCSLGGPACTNGATNYPACSNFPTGGGCTNGATNYPTCTVTAPTCTAAYICNGNTIEYQKADCSTTAVTTCDATQQCVAGSSTCVTRSIGFLGSKSTGDGQGGEGGLTLDGHLLASPKLVHQGESTHLYWNVGDAKNCALSDGALILSTAFTSGTAGLVTPPVQQQTVYTLRCNAYAGATPASIEETQTVNLIPAFQEQ